MLKDDVLLQSFFLWKMPRVNRLARIRPVTFMQAHAIERPITAELMQQLVHALHHLPSFLLGAPYQDILSICPQLEVSFCRVLHDFLGLMENLMEELPQHVPALEAGFASLRVLDRLRAFDACFMAISVAQYATCINKKKQFSHILWWPVTPIYSTIEPSKQNLFAINLINMMQKIQSVFNCICIHKNVKLNIIHYSSMYLVIIPTIPQHSSRCFLENGSRTGLSV